MPAPHVSVITLTWNVCDLLRACLRSLPLGDPRYEILVVDSASSDGTAAMVAAEFPQVRLIASTENLGYARGNNVGLRAAGGRYLFVLNPDTEVALGALEQMTAYMDGHPQVGILGPQLRNADGSVQSSRRRFPTLATGFIESTWVQPYAPRTLLNRYFVRDVPDDEITEVDWVTGAALFVRRAAYAQVGGLDEGFFMYSEELDWCRRMKSAGWQTVYFPAARILHHEAKSSAQVPAATHIRFNTSRVRYYRKYHGALIAELLRAWLLGQFVLQWLAEGAKWLVGHKRAMRALRLTTYAQVLRSGLKG